MMVGAVRPRDDVLGPQRPHRADRDGFLADRRMNAPGYLAPQRQVVRDLLEAADHDHVSEPADQVVYRNLVDGWSRRSLRHTNLHRSLPIVTS
jgi:hypothetical protein